MSELLRIYGPDELRADGYPFAWGSGTSAGAPIKDVVRWDRGNRCERCGHPYSSGAHGNGQWSPCDEQCTHEGPTMPGNTLAGDAPVYAEWRILTVHHLNGVKYDCRWWNLVALCQRCHLSVQGRVRMEQLYPHPHTEWFKPYAAAYYASVYEGVDLTREQVMARLDELLAHELDPSYSRHP